MRLQIWGVIIRIAVSVAFRNEEKGLSVKRRRKAIEYTLAGARTKEVGKKNCFIIVHTISLGMGIQAPPGILHLPNPPLPYPQYLRVWMKYGLAHK